jgi:PiT family inorganic phosphate transporter
MSTLTLLIIVILVALLFDFINGFHDTANAISTVVGTGVLSLKAAIWMAAFFNLFGAFLGTAVASTIGKGVIDPHVIDLNIILTGLVGAIVWNLITWWGGIPSSSSHALIGGLVGAAVTRAGWSSVEEAGLMKIVKSLVLSPIIGMLLGAIVMIALTWMFRKCDPAKSARTFRFLQIFSAGSMALSHGSNDAQKTMGIITMSLVIAGYHGKGPSGAFEVPFWVVFASALSMFFGTAVGGKRIIKTMSKRIVDLKPVHGFAAETSAAATIFAATALGLPVSTTHVISSSIAGVGSVKNLYGVKWGVSRRIVIAWILTIPASALVGGVVEYLSRI